MDDSRQIDAAIRAHRLSVADYERLEKEPGWRAHDAFCIVVWGVDPSSVAEHHARFAVPYKAFQRCVDLMGMTIDDNLGLPPKMWLTVLVDEFKYEAWWTTQKDESTELSQERLLGWIALLAEQALNPPTKTPPDQGELGRYLDLRAENKRLSGRGFSQSNFEKLMPKAKRALQK
jgi:hypothetical protein